MATLVDLSLAGATEAYAKVGIAVADAFIACWNTKYRDNLLRPVTYIRNLIDPASSPLLVTPPFPEYTSGHSVQSGAAAQILTNLLGDLAFVDRTHERRGLPRGRSAPSRRRWRKPRPRGCTAACTSERRTSAASSRADASAAR